jgi:hypothetical protein
VSHPRCPAGTRILPVCYSVDANLHSLTRGGDKWQRPRSSHPVRRQHKRGNVERRDARQRQPASGGRPPPKQRRHARRIKRRRYPNALAAVSEGARENEIVSMRALARSVMIYLFLRKRDSVPLGVRLMCPLLAQSRHECANKCPLLGEKRTPMLTNLDLGVHALSLPSRDKRWPC